MRTIKYRGFSKIRAERLEEIKLQCSDCGMICDNLGQHIFCGKCQDKDFDSRQAQVSLLTKENEKLKAEKEALSMERKVV